MEKSDKLGGYLFWILLGVILISLNWDRIKSLQSETWQGFFYPRGCLWCQSEYIYSRPYKSREECLAWGSQLKAQRNIPEDKFECGKNCKPPNTKDGLYVCESTVDY
ncbi:MAG: hypothetical protein HHAS10_12130 [Candidatus Altimarinota bacterium]